MTTSIRFLILCARMEECVVRASSRHKSLPIIPYLFVKFKYERKDFCQSAGKSIERTKRAARGRSFLCPHAARYRRLYVLLLAYCIRITLLPCLFEIFRIQVFEFVDNEQAILANQYIIKPNFAATVFRTLNHNQIPVNRRLVAVERVLVGHARR